jgi:hypothetical protein
VSTAAGFEAPRPDHVVLRVYDEERAQCPYHGPVRGAHIVNGPG